MVTLRQMTNAFILNGDKILLLKRANHKKIAPGLWTGVGGHIEPEEANDPTGSCIREIVEETGLIESDIQDLRLLYIVNRMKDNEIRQQYIFFAQTSATEVFSNDEGELHWIDKSKILDLEMPLTIRYTLEHYLNIKESQVIHIGTMTKSENNPVNMVWAPLIDPEFNEYLPR
jgi:8-oxo-dGTP diphosphatase